MADALTTESLGLSDSNEPLATMCAADQIPGQLIHLEARLRLTQHMEGGMEPHAIHDLLQQEIDRLVLMNFHERWPEHRQQERAGLMTLLIEQQLQVKLGLEAQLQFHRNESGGVTVTNPTNGMVVKHGFFPLEMNTAELQPLVGTEVTMECRDVFMQQRTPVVTFHGPPGTGKTETLKDICRHIIGRPVESFSLHKIQLRSVADLQPIFERMDSGVFVIIDSLEVVDPSLAAEILPALTAHAQAVHERDPSVGPSMAWTYQHSTAEAIDSQTDGGGRLIPDIGTSVIAQLHAFADPQSTVNLTRPDLSHILRVFFAKENFTRYEAVAEILVAVSCCCTPVGDNQMRLRCLDEVDTSPGAALANGQHMGMRQLRSAIDAAGDRLRETGGAGNVAAEVDAFWYGLGTCGLLTMMKEHETRTALHLAMEHVQQDSKTAAMLMSAGFPEPKQLSHMEALFACKRHGVMISQMPQPEAEAMVQQVAVARGATTNKIDLSSGSAEEVVAALAGALQSTPDGMPQVIAIGGAPLSADAWEALNTLLDDNNQIQSPSFLMANGEVISLPEGTQIIFLAETKSHEPSTSDSGSRLAVFQMGEPVTYIESALEFTSMVDLALSRPEATASLEQLRENTMQHRHRLVLRSRTGLSKPERSAVQNQLVVLQDNLRTIETLQQAGLGAAEVWHNTLKHYKVAGDGVDPAMGEVAAAEQMLHDVMAAVRPKHRGLAAARSIGDAGAVAAAEADLFAAVPIVNDARNAVAAARAAKMQVAAEVGGFSHLVNVEAAAVFGSNISTDHEILIRNRLFNENYRNYFQAKAEGKVFASAGPAGSGKTETIKDIELGLGVVPHVYQCSDEMTMDEMLGSLPEGSVVILDEFNRLSLAQMADAFRLREERGLMMSVTWNPGYAGRNKIPPELLEQCIIQNMVPPRHGFDPALELEMHRGLLSRFGFLEDLAPKFGELMIVMETQCSKQDHYDFGLRFQLAVLRHAGKLLTLDPSLDESELLAVSILQPLWAKFDDADRGVLVQHMAEVFGRVPTVPGAWTIPGPQGKAAMMGSVFENRHGAMLLANPNKFVVGGPRQDVEEMGPPADTLAALQAEAAARHAELVVIDYDGPGWNGPGWDGPGWELFADAFREASASGRSIWLTIDMTRIPWHKDWGHSPTPHFWESMNQLLDDNKKFVTSAGETIPLGQEMRILFVAPPTAVANMSPAVVSRLGIVNGLS